VPSPGLACQEEPGARMTVLDTWIRAMSATTQSALSSNARTPRSEESWLTLIRGVLAYLDQGDPKLQSEAPERGLLHQDRGKLTPHAPVADGTELAQALTLNRCPLVIQGSQVQHLARHFNFAGRGGSKLFVFVVFLSTVGLQDARLAEMALLWVHDGPGAREGEGLLLSRQDEPMAGALSAPRLTEP